MLKINLDISSVDKTLEEAGVKLDETIPQPPELEAELDVVVEQFSAYIVAVQEWGAWFGPALATLERCRGTYKNRSSLEDMNDQLQVTWVQVLCVAENRKSFYVNSYGLLLIKNP